MMEPLAEDKWPKKKDRELERNKETEINSSKGKREPVGFPMKRRVGI